MGNDTIEPQESLVLNLLAKFGLVLGKTKEALLADLRQRLPQDINNPNDIFNYIDELFEFLGYSAEGLIPLPVKNATKQSFKLAENINRAIQKIAPASDFLKTITWDDSTSVPDPVTDLGEALIILITNIIELIKSLQELFDLDTKEAQDAWEEFIRESNLERDLPKRLLDHIVSVFLENLFVVFGDDIRNLIQDIKAQLGSIEIELQETFDEFVLALIDEKASFENRLKRMIQPWVKLIQQLKSTIEKTINEEVKEKLETLKAFLNSLAYLQQAYATMKFLQIISKERVAIFFRLPENLPEILPEKELSAEIYVIHWARVEELLSNPIDYFSKIYPLEDQSDAIELINELSILARAFGLDVPDLTSLKSMLIDLLKRIANQISNGLEQTGIISILSELGKMIRSLVTLLEGSVVEFKNNIETHLSSLLANVDTDINNALNYIKTTTGTIDAEIKALIKDIHLPPVLEEADFKSSLKHILLPVVKAKAKEFKDFGNLTEKDWEDLISDIGTGYHQKIIDTKNEIETLLNKNWLTGGQAQVQAKFEAIKAKLLNEFNRQTANIPSSFEDLVDSIITQPNKLLPQELLSDFDPFAFLKIVTEELKKGMGFGDVEQYFLDFKSLSSSSFEKLVSADGATISDFRAHLPNSADMEQLKKEFAAFFNRALTDSWKEIKKTLLDVYLAPYIKGIEAVLKKRGMDLIFGIIEGLKTGSNQVYWDKIVETIPKEYLTIAKSLFPIIENSSKQSIDNWQDGIKLGLKIARQLYELYDDNEEFKNALSTILPIPKMDWSSGIDFNLPDYTFSEDDLFLSVTVYENKKSVVKSSIKFALFVGTKEVTDSNITKKYDGVFLIPIIEGELNKEISLGKKHNLILSINALLNSTGAKSSQDAAKLKESFQKGAIGAFITKGKFIWLDDLNKCTAAANLEFTRKSDAGKIGIIESKYLDFYITNYPQVLSLGFKQKAFFWSYSGKVEKGVLVLKLKSINGFFDALLKDDIKTEFDLKLIWDSQDGLSFDGNIGLKVDFNLEKKIGEVFTLHKIGMEIGKAPKMDNTLQLFVNTSFTVQISSVSLAVTGLGLGLNLNYLKEDGSLGDFDLSPTFAFPTGMAVTIDADAVKGSGVISYDSEKQEFFGALNISILEKIDVKALALLTMKMPDGRKGFSFVGLISVYFKPGIPIGMGFSLTGVGGAIGLNRNISSEAMQAGVRSGSIGAVFFVEDLENNTDVMLNNISNYFPILRDQFFFGILARISYSTFLNIEFGLLVTLPKPFKIIIVGGIHIVLPDEKAPLIQIHAYFAGGIDFDQGLLWFDASIVNSKIVFIDIYGDLALRISWGTKKGFLFSAGGFHPQYKPEASLNIGVMQRLGVKIDYSLLKMSLEAYFALTSNTVQFGAQVDIRIGWDSAKITGYFGFDCLFQFSPFWFTVEIRAGVQVKVFGINLMSVSLEFALSGPAQWNAKGVAKFSILFITFKVKFNETWGQKQEDKQISYTSIYEIISTEYLKEENWKVVSAGIQDKEVNLLEQPSENKELILQPYDTLQFEQHSVPLNTEIHRYGEGVSPSDYSKVKVDTVEIGTALFSNIPGTQDDFAPSLFLDLSQSEKLTSPSYVQMENGIKIEKDLSERAVSIASDTKVYYKIEQDIITFKAQGFQIVETDFDTGATQVKVHIVKAKKQQTSNKGKKAKKIDTKSTNSQKVLKIKLVSDSILNFVPSLSRRSENGFKHYVKRNQQIQVEMGKDRLKAFYKKTSQISYSVYGVPSSESLSKYKRADPRRKKIETVLKGEHANSYVEALKKKEEMIKNHPELRKTINIVRN